MGRKKFHGDPARFDALADFVSDQFRNSIKYVANAAGSQGMLSRVLRKQSNYESEITDPRGWTMKGVPNREAEYLSSMAL